MEDDGYNNNSDSSKEQYIEEAYSRVKDSNNNNANKNLYLKELDFLYFSIQDLNKHSKGTLIPLLDTLHYILNELTKRLQSTEFLSYDGLLISSTQISLQQEIIYIKETTDKLRDFQPFLSEIRLILIILVILFVLSVGFTVLALVLYPKLSLSLKLVDEEVRLDPKSGVYVEDKHNEYEVPNSKLSVEESSIKIKEAENEHRKERQDGESNPKRDRRGHSNGEDFEEKEREDNVIRDDASDNTTSKIKSKRVQESGTNSTINKAKKKFRLSKVINKGELSRIEVEEKEDNKSPSNNSNKNHNLELHKQNKPQEEYSDDASNNDDRRLSKIILDKQIPENKHSKSELNYHKYLWVFHASLITNFSFSVTASIMASYLLVISLFLSEFVITLYHNFLKDGTKLNLDLFSNSKMLVNCFHSEKGT
eukprot:CAMPEP_0170538220 /NCGR_PEP_ID=MMETSP0209-20121228/103183_1 /TAXON_ID=665100 ORGANISM="Litonotus pictus, Strain P1" /NCGR_SAMPLE_ID=MMETSP0209 /ASSEMBLY_ACC=CAM_ASM_000301 /LENGTH=422 /DNA_ID=CAMNT_0010839871 /DNA_START=260 /DNA_END=1525 /DNA_ORIENTATION=+